MDMEELSKSQIVLLTLLVSFVTSIATGIVTVSLMDQAPPAIAQTVNRIVERTIEKVVPEGQAASTVITTEKTIVVKESDLVAKAVEKASASLVRIYTSSTEAIFLGLGVVLDSNGTIATDVNILGDASETTFTLSDGSRLRALVTSRSEETGLAMLKPATTTVDGKTVQFTPATLAGGKSTLGQTVVVLSGKSIPRIADGIITALIPRGDEKQSIIDTNVSADFIMNGSPLIDTDGNLVGVSSVVSRASSGAGFMPSTVLVRPTPSETQKTEVSQ
jgi:S1-C subfamily serine protease